MWKKAIISISLLIICVAAYGYIQFFSGIVLPWDKEESISTTLQWGGLTELPVNHDDVSIQKTGSPFTRQFVIEFEAPEATINEWLSHNKHLKIHPFLKKPGYKIYTAKGQAGAVGGFVETVKTKVTIKMSWS